MITANSTDVRAILRKLDVPPFLATMSISYMFLLPGTSDPDSPSVIEIIKGLQRGLRKLGYKDIKVTGVFDSLTVQAIDQISPPQGSWRDKTWLQISGDVVGAMADPKRTAHFLKHLPKKPAYTVIKKNIKVKGGMGDYLTFEGPPAGPFPSASIGTPRGGLGEDPSFIDWIKGFFPKATTTSGASGGMYTNTGTVDPGLLFALGARDKNNCVPLSPTTNTAFKNLQHQINRLLYTVKKAPIAEDGILGKSTIVALHTIESMLGMSLPNIDTCSAISAQSITLGAMLSQEATSRGIPANVSSLKPSTKLPVADTAGTQVTPEMQAAAVSGGMMGMVKKYLPFIAIAGGVALFIASRKKKGRK